MLMVSSRDIRSVLFTADILVAALLPVFTIAGIALGKSPLVAVVIVGLLAVLVSDLLTKRVLLITSFVTLLGALAVQVFARTHAVDAVLFTLGSFGCFALSNAIAKRSIARNPLAARLMPTFPIGDVAISSALAALFGPFFVLYASIPTFALLIVGFILWINAQRQRGGVTHLRLPFTPAIIAGTFVLALCGANVPHFVTEASWLPNVL